MIFRHSEMCRNEIRIASASASCVDDGAFHRVGHMGNRAEQEPWANPATESARNPCTAKNPVICHTRPQSSDARPAVFAVICSESTVNRILLDQALAPLHLLKGEDSIRLWQFCSCHIVIGRLYHQIGRRRGPASSRAGHDLRL